MKFLVLALCVCAASAATLTPFGRQSQYYQPQQVKAIAETIAAPVAPAVVRPANAAYAAAKVVADAPVAAAKTVYSAAKQTYATGREAEAAVLRFDSEVNPDGYNYYYETTNGIAAQANAATKKVGDEEVVVVQGSYKYLTPEGEEILVTYVADENGYQPQSNILPVGPAIPEAIARSLEYLRTHAPAVEKY